MGFYGVLPEVPSMGQLLSRNLGQGISQGLSGGIDFAKQMALQKERGAGLANQTKQLEKVKMIENGLGTIGRMRELISEAGPSNAIQSFLGLGETREKRAELEALGRSLIPLVAAGVPIRNQREFDEYRKVITNPNSRQADLEGALNGIENILSRSVGELDEGSEEKSSSSQKQKKTKFSAENPEHKKKAEQLYKTYKDKEKVREILLREFEL